jgi:hypothetical protein
LTENIIKWRTVLIGVVVILASYVISDIMSVGKYNIAIVFTGRTTSWFYYK